MPWFVLVGSAIALGLLITWMVRTGFLLRCAGVDPAFIRTAPDGVRYTSMGAIVLLTATAATASLTMALSLVFPGHGWLRFLPAGLLWGAIVLNFDRWIVSSIDYGPLTAEETAPGRQARTGTKAVHFCVRFTMAALVGLVISEPIVLAVFGPEINQQLTTQHVSDVAQQTAQINAETSRQVAALAQPVTAAARALATATHNANTAHKIYICELTGNCHLPQGEVTGVPGLGPQTTQDFQTWQRTVAEQQKAQRALDSATAAQKQQAAALHAHARQEIAAATAKINANNGLLARERALDTLSSQNPGFLLRRVLLWLALMFIDLVPVLLKTFSPPTLADHLQRAAAVKVARNAMSDAAADSDHQSQKLSVTRTHDLHYHDLATQAQYSRRLVAAGVIATPPTGPGVTSPSGSASLGPLPNGHTPTGHAPNGHTGTNGQHSAGLSSAAAGDAGVGAAGLSAAGLGGTGLGSANLQSAGLGRGGAQAGWVVGGRWLVRRPLTDMPHSGRVPFVANDLHGEYPFEVVVKVIAPPPRAAGGQALKERRHAQMEMSLPLGHVHDNIAEVLDCDLDPDHGFYIVTRLYPATLEQHLLAATEQDSLTVGGVLEVAVQILAGLRAAWGRGFVHLDLKPANVALTAEGTVKLIDFGLAQQYERANGGNDTTTMARFTPFYAPPEQMERLDSTWISRDADIRALGAVIYRMLTGYPPLFREARALGLVDAAGHYESYTDIKRLLATVEPVPVAELITYVPEDLDMLVRQWLRTDPRMRCPGTPRTMAERAWLQLTAVAERVSTGPEAGFLAGPRVVHEPQLAHLSEQWRPRTDGQWRGFTRSGDTLDAATTDPGAAHP
ncbi:MAG TPA: DUF4407 domain-containing protein [Streptosporangiaceae bacterium]|nr:DUF4407 domain-containing protein [Streptosporangiaceae bacterium]